MKALKKTKNGTKNTNKNSLLGSKCRVQKNTNKNQKLKPPENTITIHKFKDEFGVALVAVPPK